MRRKSTRSGNRNSSEVKVEPKKPERHSKRRKRSSSRSSDSENEPLSTKTPKRATPVQDLKQSRAKELTKHESEHVSKRDSSITLSHVNNDLTEISKSNCSQIEENNSTDKTNERSAQSGTAQKDEQIGKNEEDEGILSKGKSKGKNKSKLEKHHDIEMNSDISGNVQETSPQSPTIVKKSVSDEGQTEVDSSRNETQKQANEEHSKEEESVDSVKTSEPKGIEVEFEKQLESADKPNVEASEINETNPSVMEPSANSQVKDNVDSCKNDTHVEEDQNKVSKQDEEEEGEICDEINESAASDLFGHSRISASDGSSSKTKQVEKKIPMKVKLKRDSFFEVLENLSNSETTTVKRRKWNSATCPNEQLLRITVDDIKSICPDLQLMDEEEVKLEPLQRHKSVSESESVKKTRKTSENKEEASDKPEYDKQTSLSSSVDENEYNTNIIALNRKISIVDDTASKLKPPPSPSKQPVSPVLYITNLVRPFTIKQLKELLERTGNIQQDGFWTDRIKSKCYVHYELSEEAEATRNALHGVNWPIGNGKKLMIDYSTKEELDRARNPPTPPPPAPVAVAPATPPKVKVPLRESQNSMKELKKEEKDKKEKERKKEVTREWDVGKEHQRSRSRSLSKGRRRKHSRRTPSPVVDFMSKKQRKLDEAVPQKLMDDLFSKTKAMPSIYWQPLSPEEIATKQQQRLVRMEEHKRRLEENARNRGAGREQPGRGASFRRRYD